MTSEAATPALASGSFAVGTRSRWSASEGSPEDSGSRCRARRSLMPGSLVLGPDPAGRPAPAVTGDGVHPADREAIEPAPLVGRRGRGGRLDGAADRDPG